MKKVLPTKFILGGLYPQVSGYPELCAEITQELLRENPTNLSDAFRLVQKRISENTNLFLSDEIEPVRKQNGKSRPRGEDSFAYTIIYRNGPYFEQVKRELKAKGHDVDIGGMIDMAFTYELVYENPSVPSIVIPLTKISNRRNPYTGETYPNFRIGEITFLHPAKDDLPREGVYFSENIWSECSRFFRDAAGETAPAKSRRTSSYMFYGLASHDMPLDRLSSSMLRIMLEYLAVKNGFDHELGQMKGSNNLNITALMRSPDEFTKLMLDKKQRAELFNTSSFERAGKKMDQKILRKNDPFFEFEESNKEKIFQIISELDENKEPVVFLEDIIASIKKELDIIKRNENT